MKEMSLGLCVMHYELQDLHVLLCVADHDVNQQAPESRVFEISDFLT